MPRPNPPRAMDTERHLARRIAYERERAPMTYDGLAKRMTDIGCPINASAIYKIEKGEPGRPPRRITVDELVAFAKVFGLATVDELLAPPELAGFREGQRLLYSATGATYETEQAQRRELAAILELMAHLEAHPDTEPALRASWDEGEDPDAAGYFASHLAYFAAVRDSGKAWDDPFSDPDVWPNLLAVQPKRARRRG